MNKQLDLTKYQDKKLIAFDLYGTCIDHSFKNYRLSDELREILKIYPITLQEIQERKLEKNGVKIKIDNELIEKTKQDIEGTFLFPDTLEALKYIKSKGYKTAVVSNLSKDYAEPLHRLIPEGNFDYEILSFDVGAVKPDPKIYEYLKSISGTDFKDIVMIGDSLKADVLGSNNVGITPIHVNRESVGGIEKVSKKGIDFIQISTLANLKELF